MTSQKQTQAVDRGRVCIPPTPKKTVHLSKHQAACWLDQLAEMTNKGGRNADCLEELRDHLEDCGWLACWKREDVIVELCPSLLSGVLEELLQISQADPSIGNPETLAEIIQVLARSA